VCCWSSYHLLRTMELSVISGLCCWRCASGGVPLQPRLRQPPSPARQWPLRGQWPPRKQPRQLAAPPPRLARTRRGAHQLLPSPCRGPCPGSGGGSAGRQGRCRTGGRHAARAQPRRRGPGGGPGEEAVSGAGEGRGWAGGAIELREFTVDDIRRATSDLKKKLGQGGRARVLRAPAALHGHPCQPRRAPAAGL